MKGEMVTLTGEVRKILFENRENGYTVCVLEDADGKEYTLTGTLPALFVGEALVARAVAATHPIHGVQWRVTEFEKQLPQDEAAILRYLSSRAVRGIGPKLAARIVERFGADTLSVLEHSPEMLASVPGVSKKVARAAGDEFRAQFGLRQVVLFFGGTFGMKTSMNIYRALGSGAVELVRKNPYLLCERVRGIGFVRADKLAQSIGYQRESPARLSAGVLHLLDTAYYKDGHVYLPKDELLERAAALLSVGKEPILETLEELVRDGRCVATYSGENIYLAAAYKLEHEAAERLLNLSRIKLLDKIPGADKIIRQSEAAEGVTYAPCQREAILAAAHHPFSVITGGPGTGKTTITRALVRLFEDLGMKVCLAAPTGRAAKRMSEKAHLPARTLHRVLEMAYLPDDARARFGRDEQNPLEEKVFLIDEVSMIDLELLVSFLRAVRPGSRVVFIGDADQLPSVGAGNVLSDLILSGAFCVTRLDVIYRQKEGSSILNFAHEVREGKHHPLRENEGDLFYLARPDALATAETIASLVAHRLPRSYGEESRKTTRVLAPSRRGPAGTIALNARLQAVLNPRAVGKKEVPFGDVVFREGDCVMQIKNDYDLEIRHVLGEGTITSRGVFNGDIGEIVTIDPKEEVLTVLFEDGGLVEYPFSLLDELEHAWAITVHKSQGSEFETVVFVASGVPPMLCRRALLYTAVTRAKKRLILVGSQEITRRMAQNDAPESRYSALKDRIREAL